MSTSEAERDADVAWAYAEQYLRVASGDALAAAAVRALRQAVRAEIAAARMSDE